MRALSTDTLKMWRWIFIAVQTAVFVTFSLAVILEFGFGILFEPPVAFMACYMVALLFLLIASPFFFKRLGKLAVIGWFVTLAILILSMCSPAGAGHL
jgi:hypothetical protein